jgi:hypothetical protein
MTKEILFVVLISFVSLILHAQKIDKKINLSDTTQVHQLNMKDGAVLYGRLISFGAESWVFEHNHERLTFGIKTIESVEVSGDKSNKRYIGQDDKPSCSQVLSLNSTAFPLKKREFYYHSTYGLYHNFEMGLGKGFSVGLGLLVPIIPSVTLKYSHKITKNFNAGLSNNFLVAGLGTSKLDFTLGTPDMFLNFGGGIVYGKGVLMPHKWGYMQYYHLGGSIKLHRNWSLITDNSFIYRPNEIETFLPSLIARRLFKRGHLDFGVLAFNIPIGTYMAVIPLPYLGFGCKFGKV